MSQAQAALPQDQVRAQRTKEPLGFLQGRGILDPAVAHTDWVLPGCGTPQCLLCGFHGFLTRPGEVGTRAMPNLEINDLRPREDGLTGHSAEEQQTCGNYFLYVRKLSVHHT